MLKRFSLALAFVAVLSGAAFAVPQAASSAMAFAFQAFISVGGSTAVNLVTRLGWQLTPYDFGAVGDGAADDTAAVQAWLTALAINGGEGFCPVGTYRLTASVNGFSSANYYHMRGAGDACYFYVDFNGWGNAAIDLTNPATLTIPATSFARGVRVEWDHFKIGYNLSLTAPPIAFRDRYATALTLHDFYLGQFTSNRGTVLALSNVWNMEHLRNGEVWGGGGRIAQHLVPSGTTFSITASTNTLTSNVPFFSASDTGVTFYCLGLGGSYGELFTVTYVNSTTVTTSRNASVTHTNQNCSSQGVTGSMTSGSNVLTLSANNVPTSFVGRTVYVEAAAQGNSAGQQPFLRGIIGSVTPGSPETLTLLLPDQTAANATNSVSGTTLIFDPAIDLYSEGNSNAATNDVYFDNIHSEDYAGTALVVSTCTADCTIMRQKFASNYFNSGATFGQTAFESEFDAVLSNSDVNLLEFVAEQANVGFTQLLVEGQNMPISIGNSTGLLTTGQYHVAMKNNSYGSFVTVGLANSSGQFDANGWCRNLYYNDGSSQYGIMTQSGSGGRNSANCLPDGYYGVMHPFSAFMGAASALNSGDYLAISYSNAFVAESIKSSMTIGQTCLNLGSDQSNKVFYACTVGSTGTAYNGASSSNIFGKYGLWLSGGTAAGTGLQSDTSGNFTEHGVFGLTAATWANNQSCTAGQISVDASYVYVCTATNTVKRVALSTF